MLQHHLARGSQADSGDKHLYVLDESSLASTRQIHEFLQRLGVEDRVLLAGDVRQHEAIEAGRPYSQLQQAGMRTATWTKSFARRIRRSRKSWSILPVAKFTEP